MDEIDLIELDEAFAELFRLMAGDPIIAVGPDGSQEQFDTFEWEPDSDTNSSFEGLQIDAAGMTDQEENNVLLLKSQIEAKGWNLDATDHFLVAGVRWDFAEDKPIRRRIAPIAGWQGLIMITIRKAVELNSSTPGTEFTIAD